MKKNIGTTDRIFRLIVALLIFAYAVWQSSWLALLISFFVLYEAVASWCIVYALLGKNSCPISKK